MVSPANFRLRAVYGVRLLGVGCVLLALAVTFWIVRNVLDASSNPVVTILCVVVSVPALAITVLGLGLSVLRPTLLRLDDVGLRNRTGRGVGARTVGWKDIKDVGWASDHAAAGAGPVLLVTLADGRTSRVHTALLDAGATTIESAVRTRADNAFGYRPL